MSYAGVIFYLSGRPLPEDVPLFKPLLDLPHGDKLLHIVEYLVFGILAFKAFAPSGRRGILKVLFISLGYAALDETRQAFVSFRDFCILDWVADSLGVFIGLSIGHFWR